jgi:hypothetical protein
MTDWTDARQRVERLIRDANGSPDADGRGWTAGVGDADADALRALLAQVDHWEVEYHAERERSKALQDSIDGCTRKVQELSQRASLSREDREQALEEVAFNLPDATTAMAKARRLLKLEAGEALTPTPKGENQPTDCLCDDCTCGGCGNPKHEGRCGRPRRRR